MTSPVWSFALPDEGRLVELARIMRQNLQAPLVIYLHGDLGSGKTTFARALIHALGYSGRVKSPSYGLLEPYAAGGFNILHLDFYRIESPAELEYLAIGDLFNENSILLVEWPEKGAGVLAPADVELHFDETAGQRFVQLKARSMAGASLVQATRQQYKNGNFQGNSDSFRASLD
jgi:tRNA threonylcarbamoyladenosine biosynthesis protein TsaE